MEKEEGDYLSMGAWSDVVLWVPSKRTVTWCQLPAPELRHPSIFQAKKFRGLRAAPCQAVGTGGLKKTDLLLVSQSITCLTLTPLVEY